MQNQKNWKTEKTELLNTLSRIERGISRIESILKHDQTAGKNARIFQAAESFKGLRFGDMIFRELLQQRVNYSPERHRTEVEEKSLFFVSLEKPDGGILKVPARITYYCDFGPDDLESENLQLEIDLTRVLK